ncbi:MAG TPA: hypothetical protein VGB95_00085 [Chitinophagales bacterium]
MIEAFKKHVQANGVKLDEKKFAFFQTRINTLMKAYFAKQKWQAAAFYLIENDEDKVVEVAIKEVESRK